MATMPSSLAFKVSRLMILQVRPFSLVVLNTIMAAMGAGILGLVDLSTVVMIRIQTMTHMGVIGISLAR